MSKFRPDYKSTFRILKGGHVSLVVSAMLLTVSATTAHAVTTSNTANTTADADASVSVRVESGLARATSSSYTNNYDYSETAENETSYENAASNVQDDSASVNLQAASYDEALQKNDSFTSIGANGIIFDLESDATSITSASVNDIDNDNNGGIQIGHYEDADSGEWVDLHWVPTGMSDTSSTIAAAAASAASTTSEMSGNTIVTSQEITSNGIVINAISSSTADANATALLDSDVVGGTDTNNQDESQYAAASAGAASYAESKINNNDITNTFDITSDEYGIGLFANSDATGTATATASGEDANDLASDESAAAEAFSEIAGNSITNSGMITADDGIMLMSTSYADESNSTEEYSYSKLISNNINNSGDIDGTEYGIGLLSGAFNNGQISETEISDNIVTNTGRIDGYFGISVMGEDYSDGEASLTITGNTITNGSTLGGEDTGIMADEDGISIWGLAGSDEYNSDMNISENTVINNDMISAGEDGIRLMGEDYADQNASLAMIGNTITNEGAIIAGEDGINIWGMADSRFGNSDLTISENNITNNNYIYTEGEDGIRLVGEDYAESNASVMMSENIITNDGEIDAGASGIALYAMADTDYTNGFDSNVTIAANTITNNDYLYADNGTGILLVGNSWSDGNASTLITQNIITNNGEIDANDNGIELSAYTYTDSEGEAVTTISDNRIINNGEINAGTDGIHIDANDGTEDKSTIAHNVIINSGDIIAFHDGIYLDALDINDINISNSGTIITDDDDGIDFNADNISNINITNSGKMITDDNGITLNADFGDLNASNIINDGLIDAGDIAIKLRAGHIADNNITNNGSIVAVDTGISLVETSVATLTGNNITNNGLIDAPIAIDMNGTAGLGEGNTLNLNIEGYIAGEILLDADANVTVNLEHAHATHSVAWTIQTPNAGADNNFTQGTLTGPNPLFVSGDENGTIYSTYDPSAFAAAENMMADLSGMVSDFARDNKEKDGFWIAGQALKMDYNGLVNENIATMDQEHRLSGMAVGFNKQYDTWLMSILGGYSNGNLKVGSLWSDYYSNSYDNDQKGGFLAVHASAPLGKFVVDFGLSAGQLNHDDRRFVNDNLADDLDQRGASYAVASYDSIWYSPEITLSLPMTASDSLTITPSVRYQYTAQNIDGYTETGAADYANTTVADRDIAVGEFNAELAVSKQVNSTLTLSARGGYMARSSQGDDQVLVEMNGVSNDVPFTTQDVQAGYAGASINVKLGEQANLSVSGNYVDGSEIDSSYKAGAMLSIKY